MFRVILVLLWSGSGNIATGSSTAVCSHLARLVEGGAVLLLSSTFLVHSSVRRWMYIYYVMFIMYVTLIFLSPLYAYTDVIAPRLVWPAELISL